MRSEDQLEWINNVVILNNDVDVNNDDDDDDVGDEANDNALKRFNVNGFALCVYSSD